MLAVAIRADDWFFIYLLTALFLPFSDDFRRRYIVTLVTFLTQSLSLFVASALLPSADDCRRLDVVGGVTLPAGGINFVSRVHSVGRGKVVLIVFVGDGLAVAIRTGQICFSVGLSKRFILVICMADETGSVFRVCRGDMFRCIGRPI